jgi:hypothetical protein
LLALDVETIWLVGNMTMTQLLPTHLLIQALNAHVQNTLILDIFTFGHDAMDEVGVQCLTLVLHVKIICLGD